MSDPTPRPTPAPPPAPRIRARILQTILCTAVGILLTIASAWTCALWSRNAMNSPPFQVMGVIERNGKARPFPQTSTARGFGFRLEMDKHVELFPGNAIGMADDTDRYVAGWPFSSMGCRVLYAVSPSAGSLATTQISGKFADGRAMWLVDGLRPPRRAHALPARFIPLRARPVGFIADTLIAAAPLWLALFGRRDIRLLLRLRRGHCTRCAYPVRGLPQCPECGTPNPTLPRVLLSFIRSFPARIGAIPALFRRGAPPARSTGHRPPVGLVPHLPPASPEPTV